MKGKFNKNTIILITIPVLFVILLLGSCFGGRASAPKDTVEISKRLMQTQKKRQAVLSSRVFSQDIDVIYKAIRKTFNEIPSSKKNTIIQYKYDDLLKQYNTISTVQSLYVRKDQVKGAVVASEHEKDKKSLIIAFVDPSPEGVEVSLGTFYGYKRVVRVDVRPLLDTIEENAKLLDK